MLEWGSRGRKFESSHSDQNPLKQNASADFFVSKNIDLKRGSLVTVTAFLGTVVGSYCGYLVSQRSPDGLGYISMLTTVFLGFKFLLKPITGGHGAGAASGPSTGKTVLAMVLGCGIGWVCGFTGSGGGILMLTVFTLVLGYNLKVAVGTSTMIMSLIALTGAVSHVSLGAQLFPLPMAIVVASCLLGAVVSAKFANRCEIRRLNRIVGIVLILLGAVTLLIKLL